MTEKEKMLHGLLYDANYDEDLLQQRRLVKELCFEFNHIKPSDEDSQQRLLKRLLGKLGCKCTILPPFFCDYGENIDIGDHFFSNHNLIILDGAKVTFGNYVFIAPNCCFSTAGHPLDTERRNAGLEFARPISVGSNVWFGANVTVLPGVTIGDNSVIGAGSVVNKDIPSGVVAVGNPCKVLREITDADNVRY